MNNVKLVGLLNSIFKKLQEIKNSQFLKSQLETFFVLSKDVNFSLKSESQLLFYFNRMKMYLNEDAQHLYPYIQVEINQKLNIVELLFLYFFNKDFEAVKIELKLSNEIEKNLFVNINKYVNNGIKQFKNNASDIIFYSRISTLQNINNVQNMKDLYLTIKNKKFKMNINEFLLHCINFVNWKKNNSKELKVYLKKSYHDKKLCFLQLKDNNSMYVNFLFTLNTSLSQLILCTWREIKNINKTEIKITQEENTIGIFLLVVTIYLIILICCSRNKALKLFGLLLLLFIGFALIYYVTSLNNIN